MTYAFIVAALLTVTDPSGDTIGNGTLTPPTAAPFRSLSVFDVQEIRVPDEPTFGVVLTMGRVNEPWEASGGFPLPIIEVYLSSGEGGRDELLPGSGMRLPPDRRWHYAFQIAGEQFRMLRASSDGVTDVTEDYNATLAYDDNRFIISSSLPVPEDFRLYGMVGSYDPFSRTGWRPVLEEPSPWAFSSDTQTVPVIDVIAEDFAQQQQAIDSRTLPEIRPPTRQNYWLWVMASGLVFIAAGLAGRFTVRTPDASSAELADTDSEPETTAPVTTQSADAAEEETPAALPVNPRPNPNDDDLEQVLVPNYRRLNVPYKLPEMPPLRRDPAPQSAAPAAAEPTSEDAPGQVSEVEPPATASSEDERPQEAAAVPTVAASPAQDEREGENVAEKHGHTSLSNWLDFDFDEDDLELLELEEEGDTWRQPSVQTGQHPEATAPVKQTEKEKEEAGSSRG